MHRFKRTTTQNLGNAKSSDFRLPVQPSIRRFDVRIKKFGEEFEIPRTLGQPFSSQVFCIASLHRKSGLL
jgi:hypothetical protein